MNGLELLSRMQKEPKLSSLPIAMLTRGADRHRQMAVELGASGYITKPYLKKPCSMPPNGCLKVRYCEVQQVTLSWGARLGEAVEYASTQSSSAPHSDKPPSLPTQPPG